MNGYVSHEKKVEHRVNQGKALAPIKLMDSPPYNWSAILEKYALSVVSMRPEGKGVLLVCHGSYASLLSFLDNLIGVSVEVSIVSLSLTSFDVRITPQSRQMDKKHIESLDVSTIGNPFKGRLIVPHPLTVDYFLQAHWRVIGYVRNGYYLCLYLCAEDQSLLLYPKQQLFNEGWEVQVLTPQGVVMWNRKSGSTLKKQFDLPKAPKNG